MHPRLDREVVQGLPNPPSMLLAFGCRPRFLKETAHLFGEGTKTPNRSFCSHLVNCSFFAWLEDAPDGVDEDGRQDDTAHKKQ